MSEYVTQEKFLHTISILNTVVDQVHKRVRGQRIGIWLLGLGQLLIFMILADIYR